MGCSPQPSPPLMMGTEAHLAASCGCALLEMPHHDHVAIELQHLDSILDGLLVEVPGTRHLGICKTGHMPAQAVHGSFVRQARAGGRLIEGRHQGLLCKQVAVSAADRNGFQLCRHVENVEKFLSFKILEGQNVPTSKTTHFYLQIKMRDRE